MKMMRVKKMQMSYHFHYLSYFPNLFKSDYRVLQNNVHFLHLKNFDCSCLRVADCDQPSHVHVALAVRAYQRRHFQCKTNNMLSDYRYPQFPNHPAASSAVTANEAR